MACFQRLHTKKKRSYLAIRDQLFASLPVIKQISRSFTFFFKDPYILFLLHCSDRQLNCFFTLVRIWDSKIWTQIYGRKDLPILPYSGVIRRTNTQAPIDYVLLKWLQIDRAIPMCHAHRQDHLNHRPTIIVINNIDLYRSASKVLLSFQRSLHLGEAHTGHFFNVRRFSQRSESYAILLRFKLNRWTCAYEEKHNVW